MSYCWSGTHAGGVNTELQPGAIVEGEDLLPWTNIDPDLYRHMVSLDHNELMFYFVQDVSIWK